MNAPEKDVFYTYDFLKKYLLILREWASRRGAEGGKERESQAGSTLTAQSPTRGWNLWMVRSWPEPKPRVGRLTNWATQAPLKCHDFLKNSVYKSIEKKWKSLSLFPVLFFPHPFHHWELSRCTSRSFSMHIHLFFSLIMPYLQNIESPLEKKPVAYTFGILQEPGTEMGDVQ